MPQSAVPAAIEAVSRHLEVAVNCGSRHHVADARFYTLLSVPGPDNPARTSLAVRTSCKDVPAPVSILPTRRASPPGVESRAWREYFESNARVLLEIPWQAEPALTAEERRSVAASVQEFQAGEASEGRHLYRLAQAYAERTGDVEYVRAIRLFIGEEQRHARDLGRCLTLNGIPLVRTTALDHVFRRLRNLVPSLELSVAVLVTAELIAIVYYAALREATHSPALRRLCDQILRDEQAHVAFQWQQLHRLRARRHAAIVAVTNGAQRVLYAGTVLVVWSRHRAVVRRGGLTLWRWWAECWAEFERAASAVGSPARRSALVAATIGPTFSG